MARPRLPTFARVLARSRRRVRLFTAAFVPAVLLTFAAAALAAPSPEPLRLSVTRAEGTPLPVRGDFAFPAAVPTATPRAVVTAWTNAAPPLAIGLPPAVAEAPSPTPDPATSGETTAPPDASAATASEPTTPNPGGATGAGSPVYLPDVPRGPATELEQRLFEGINAERARAGLPALEYDEGLQHVARIRSQQMADQGYFGHRDANGRPMYVELLALFGYSYAWAGENLAVNNYDASESPERALVSLLASASHRDNLLTTDFTRVGVGVVSLADGRHIYTMVFLG